MMKDVYFGVLLIVCLCLMAAEAVFEMSHNLNYGVTMSVQLSNTLAVLEALLPEVEPPVQAAIDAKLVAAEAAITAAASGSVDLKNVEEAGIAMVKAIVDAEGARLAAL